MPQETIAVPKPKDENSLADNFIAFDQVVRLLRQHCPWDRKQTNESIAVLLVEETYELLDAIKKGNDEEFSKELGDVLLHVVMHAVMAEERGAFDMKDVLRRSCAKLVHRHPHVFGSTQVSGSDEVLQNWESQKMKEGQRSILDGVPQAMPALLRAQRIQHKAANVGFDWDNREDVWAKVDEELAELKHEILDKNTAKAKQELGDFIFAIVNAARFEDIMAEEALQSTNDKFTARFKYIEEKAKAAGKSLKDMTLGEMDEIWNEAKEMDCKGFLQLSQFISP